MATATRICKVCGKEYQYCKTWLGTNKFRYQDVACSPACGSIYFANIASSRGESTDDTDEVVEVKKTKKISKRTSKKVSVEEPVESVEQEVTEEKTEETDE